MTLWTPIPIPYDIDEAQRMFDEWDMNCGPSALAAILGRHPEEVLPHMEGFKKKHYTNIRMMYKALDSLKIAWENIKPPRLANYGLCRIEWDGPWTDGYWYEKARHSHWIATVTTERGIRVFDVNALMNGGWIWINTWKDHLVPWLLKESYGDEAYGTWKISHCLEVTL